MPRPRNLLGAVCALALLVAPISGCGGDDESGAGDEDRRKPATKANPPELKGDPLGLAEAEESIDEAAARIDEAIGSDDCDDVNELNPLGRPGLSTDQRCEFLRTRLDLKLADAEEFEGGGVIDYEFGEPGASAVTIVDEDGQHHVALVDSLLDGESVGTKPAKEFDAAADEALKALEERDCDAFVAIAHRRYGAGSAPERNQTCTFAKNNPVPNVLESYPKASLDSLGGNGDYALYGLSTPAAHFTLVFARQQDPDALPEAYEPLPKDAAEHAFVDIYVTNRAQPTE